VDDAEDDWTYSQKFDYIHGRLLFSCFNDMAGVVRKAYDELEPGGYLEMQEINCRLHGVDDTTKGTAIQRWTDLIIEGAARFGKDWECGARLKEFFFAAGFEEVVELHYAFPTNMWPKSRHKKLVGLYQMTNMLDGMQGISTRVLTKGLGMSIEEMELFLVDVREALQNRHIHGYWPV
jgi:hypothetical protein